jgi:hypothetical protein
MDVGGNTMFVPHVGPVEMMVVILMGLVTGIVWLVDKGRGAARN